MPRPGRGRCRDGVASVSLAKAVGLLATISHGRGGDGSLTSRRTNDDDMTRATAKTASPARNLKQERDRFVALAFTAADILLELDRERTIRFAAGATTGLVGCTQEQLLGRRVDEIVIEEDRGIVATTLDNATQAGRFEPIMVRLRNERRSSPTKAILSGYRLPDMGGHYYLAISLPKYLVATDIGNAARDEETGLINATAFAKLAKHRLEETDSAGADYEMTLLHLERFGLMRRSVDKQLTDEFMSNLSALLRANSVVGDSAARIDGETYGMIHPAHADIERLKDEVRSLARIVDPHGDVLGLRMATMTMDAENLPDSDMAKAIDYVVRQVSEGRAQGRVGGLSQVHRNMVDDTARRISDYRDVIKRRQFRVAFQPIVELQTRRTKHYEALIRLKREDGISPFEMITFAEQAGFIEEVDSAMCERVIYKIKRAARHGKKIHIAVNLSARSIESDAFVDRLHRMLDVVPSLRRRILFEITESAQIHDLDRANRVIQSLRRAGHKVCLDDFGTGSAAFQYLRALRVDMVKIDGTYVRDALKTDFDRSFLSAIIQLCHGLDVVSIGEMIEDEPTAAFLRDNGVLYGQGFLFGRPSFDIADLHD